MLVLLENWFPGELDVERGNASLTIRAVEFGSRLTHDHQAQFKFVGQSLYLWLEVRGECQGRKGILQSPGCWGAMAGHTRIWQGFVLYLVCYASDDSLVAAASGV